ncbi:conserved hypothetical protein [Ricinus communis]|uniref:Uncharacterized protein n=1 Tax=Ricinus communis TaxID=3988 RepID=B9SYT4_RICCO|nr:conserved hypothetical protein [Ricinus communis]
MYCEGGGLVFVFSEPAKVVLHETLYKPPYHSYIKPSKNPKKHTIEPTNLHFSPFLNKGTATAHEMREKIIHKASLQRTRWCLKDPFKNFFI